MAEPDHDSLVQENQMKNESFLAARGYPLAALARQSHVEKERASAAAVAKESSERERASTSPSVFEPRNGLVPKPTSQSKVLTNRRVSEPVRDARSGVATAGSSLKQSNNFLQPPPQPPVSTTNRAVAKESITGERASTSSTSSLVLDPRNGFVQPPSQSRVLTNRRVSEPVRDSSNSVATAGPMLKQSTRSFLQPHPQLPIAPTSSNRTASSANKNYHQTQAINRKKSPSHSSRSPAGNTTRNGIGKSPAGILAPVSVVKGVQEAQQYAPQVIGRPAAHLYRLDQNGTPISFDEGRLSPIPPPGLGLQTPPRLAKGVGGTNTPKQLAKDGNPPRDRLDMQMSSPGQWMSPPNFHPKANASSISRSSSRSSTFFDANVDSFKSANEDWGLDQSSYFEDEPSVGFQGHQSWDSPMPPRKYHLDESSSKSDYNEEEEEQEIAELVKNQRRGYRDIFQEDNAATAADVDDDDYGQEEDEDFDQDENEYNGLVHSFTYEEDLLDSTDTSRLERSGLVDSNFRSLRQMISSKLSTGTGGGASDANSSIGISHHSGSAQFSFGERSHSSSFRSWTDTSMAAQSAGSATPRGDDDNQVSGGEIAAHAMAKRSNQAAAAFRDHANELERKLNIAQVRCAEVEERAQVLEIHRLLLGILAAISLPALAAAILSHHHSIYDWEITWVVVAAWVLLLYTLLYWAYKLLETIKVTIEEADRREERAVHLRSMKQWHDTSKDSVAASGSGPNGNSDRAKRRITSRNHNHRVRLTSKDSTTEQVVRKRRTASKLSV